MSLLDIFTGGNAGSAKDALKRAEEYFSNVKTPTAQELTLPILEKYVEAGIMTPAQAQAYLQQNNAYAEQEIPQTGTAAQVAALNQLSQVANAGPEGTPMQQAQMENSLQQMRTADQGEIGAIEQAMAAKGTPRALIQAAMASQVHGQNAQQAHNDAVNAQAAAYQTALNAMSQGGQLGGQLQGQQNQQANTVAQAANAMQQFNAQNQQQNAQFNAANQQASNMANSANRQNVSNANVGTSNERTKYNANLPQQVFQNQMAKAQGQAGAASNIGNLYQQQGQQNAGLIGGMINAATSFIPKPGAAAGMPFQPQNPTEAAFNQQYQRGYAHGGVVKQKSKGPIGVGSTRGYTEPLNCADGSIIPGEATFPGDSMENDTVPIMASPGEAVISREAVASNPDAVGDLLNGQTDTEIVDVQDVAMLLKALRAIRTGAA